MIPVVALPPGDQWDQNLLDELFANRLYPTGLEFERCTRWPDTEGVVLIIPGRYWAHDVYGYAEINDHIAHYAWVLAIRTGDEEDLFNIRRVKHPNITWWIQTPKVGKDYGGARPIPLGYPPHFNHLRQSPPDKNLKVFLSGQCTHDRRRQAFEALGVARYRADEVVNPTSSFTEGMTPSQYAEHMTMAKVAPAPSGPVTADTFRVYEALEAHAIPIADDVAPVDDSTGYWALMCPGAPFPVLRDYTDLPGYVSDSLADWPRQANRITAWWINYKRALAHALCDDLATLVAPGPPITVLITTSPIKSHPETHIIDETIASVRAQLPDAEIILVHDGVRAEQEGMREAYEEYIGRVLWKANHQWHNVLPLIFDEHLHQAVCTKRAIERVRTPLLLFIEGDTPLTDGDIPWTAISDAITNGDANVVRFSHEVAILEPHRYLMLDDEPQKVAGVPMTRTIQWSQRPHLASVVFYRSLLARCFPKDEHNFIEDVAYGKLVVDHDVKGDAGWLGWRTWLYTPEGNIKRSYHTDGRAGADKYDR